MSSTEITEALADDHDLWEQEFLDGWAQLQKNGYGDGLINGPENSWLGYSLVPEGKISQNKCSDKIFILRKSYRVPLGIWSRHGS